MVASLIQAQSLKPLACLNNRDTKQLGDLAGITSANSRTAVHALLVLFPTSYQSQQKMVIQHTANIMRPGATVNDITRVGQNCIYTVHIHKFWLGIYQIYSVYIYVYIQFWPTLDITPRYLGRTAHKRN